MEPLELDFGVTFRAIPAEHAGRDDRIIQRGGIYSALPPALGFGSRSAGTGVGGSYSVDAATRLLQTDADYTRQTGQARDTSSAATAAAWRCLSWPGGLLGQAPLFDRFVLGNASIAAGLEQVRSGSHWAVRTSCTVRSSIPIASIKCSMIRVRCGITPQEREQKQSVGVGFKKEGFSTGGGVPAGRAPAHPGFLTPE